MQWLVEHVVGQMDQKEMQARNHFGQSSGAAEIVRRDAEDWARQLLRNSLAEGLLHPLSEAPDMSPYTPASYAVERVASLCAICAPSSLSFACAKLFVRQGDYFGAISIALLTCSLVDTQFIQWAVSDLLPKAGVSAMLPAIQIWSTNVASVETCMALANTLMATGEEEEGLRWANTATAKEEGRQM